MDTEFGKALRQIREQRGMTLEEMAKYLNTTKQALSRYERGERTPKITVASEFADILGVDLAVFVGEDGEPSVKIRLPEGVIPISQLAAQSVPLIGNVAAGNPITAEENIELYVDSPAKADYALRVKGDSMEPTYVDGDIVYIRMTEIVREGTVAVVLIDDEACIKHVYFIPNGVQLVSDNPKYPPMICTWPEHDNIRVLGVVVGFTRMY